jgi:hypothetical protein
LLVCSARACRAGAPARCSSFDLGAPVPLASDAAPPRPPPPRTPNDAPATVARLVRNAVNPPEAAAASEGAAGAAADAAAETDSLALWSLAYGELCEEALALGIPRRALPPLPTPASAAGVRAAATLLGRIIASRLSSNL